MNLHLPTHYGRTARGVAILAIVALVALLAVPGFSAAAPAGPSTGDNVPVKIPGQEDLTPTELPPVVTDELAALAASSPEASIWLANFCNLSGEICTTGDVNGDGKADLVRFVRSSVQGTGQGSVWVAISTGAGFLPQAQWQSGFCVLQEECRVADVNNDNMDDILAFVRGTTGTIWVATSNGSGFNPGVVWRTGFCVLDEICETGDMNNDGFDDAVAFNRSAGKVWVTLSSGFNFGTPAIWNPSFPFCGPGETCTTGDFNADGRDDVIAFARNYGAVWVALSNGAGLNRSSLWNQVLFCIGWEECRVGDFNGDRRADIAAFLRSTQPEPKRGDVYVALSSGSSFGASQLWHNAFCLGTETCEVGDVNGDERVDLLAFTRGTGGYVWVELSPGPPPWKQVMNLLIRVTQ